MKNIHNIHINQLLSSVNFENSKKQNIDTQERHALNNRNEPKNPMRVNPIPIDPGTSSQKAPIT